MNRFAKYEFIICVILQIVLMFSLIKTIKKVSFLILVFVNNKTYCYWNILFIYKLFFHYIIKSLFFLFLFAQIKLVNINSTDLVDGRPPVVLGLIWTIILYFQVRKTAYEFLWLTAFIFKICK